MPLLIPILLVVGAAGGGVYFLGKFLGPRIESNIEKVHDYAKDAVKDIKSDFMVIANGLMEFLTTKVWPRVLTIFRILQAYMLMLIISHCDAYLKTVPRSPYETLFATVICYSCWMYVAYFLFKILLDDILLRAKQIPEVLVVILVMIFGVLLPFWEMLKDYFEAYFLNMGVLLSTRINELHELIINVYG